MKYKFYYSTTSPYVRKTHILLKEFNLLEKTDAVLIKPEDIDENLNPLKKIPLLIIDGHKILADSTAICVYFDETYNNKNYFEPAGVDKFKFLSDYFLVKGLIDSAVIILLETRRQAPLQAEIDKQLTKIKAGLNYLTNLQPLRENKLDMLSIATLCLWDYLKFRLPDMINYFEFDALIKWRTTFESASINSTMPKVS